MTWEKDKKLGAYADRMCPKHPDEKMTLLFNGYICDVCEPPKNKDVRYKWWNEFPFNTQFPNGSRLYPLHVGNNQLPNGLKMYMRTIDDCKLFASIVLIFNQPSLAVFIWKNRFYSYTPRYVYIPDEKSGVIFYNMTCDSCDSDSQCVALVEF